MPYRAKFDDAEIECDTAEEAVALVAGCLSRASRSNDAGTVGVRGVREEG
jgi:hypothetical protein